MLLGADANVNAPTGKLTNSLHLNRTSLTRLGLNFHQLRMYSNKR